MVAKPSAENSAEQQGPGQGFGALSQQGTPDKPKYKAIYANVGDGSPPPATLVANVTLDDKPGVVALVHLELKGQGKVSVRYQGELVFAGKVYAATLKVVRIGRFEFGDFTAVPKVK